MRIDPWLTAHGGALYQWVTFDVFPWIHYHIFSHSTARTTSFNTPVVMHGMRRITTDQRTDQSCFVCLVVGVLFLFLFVCLLFVFVGFLERKEMFYLTTHSTHFILRLDGVGCCWLFVCLFFFVFFLVCLWGCFLWFLSLVLFAWLLLLLFWFRGVFFVGFLWWVGCCLFVFLVCLFVVVFSGGGGCCRCCFLWGV